MAAATRDGTSDALLVWALGRQVGPGASWHAAGEAGGPSYSQAGAARDSAIAPLWHRAVGISERDQAAIYTAACSTSVMVLKLTPAQLSEIRRQGEAAYPNECCGALTDEMLADGSKRVLGVAPCSNTHNDSSRSWYQIDPRELVRIQREAYERGEDVIGFYHSHPDDAAQWSASDLEEAHWTGCSYVIISVEKGVAAQANSFELVGEEANKSFEQEEIIAEELILQGEPER